MVRCKSCLTKAEAENGNCPVCGIRQDKSGRELLPDEKRVRHFARCLLGVAGMHVVGFGLCLYVLLVVNPQAAAEESFVFPAAIVIPLAIINLSLAFGLARYTFWAYRLATVFYFLVGIANIVSVQIPGILLMLLLLYFVGNGTSKAIFERRAMDPA